MSVLVGAVLLFLLMRIVCEPKLSPGREIWNRVLKMEPADAVLLAGVRFVGTFGLMVALGSGLGVAVTWWVESLDLVELGSEPGQRTLEKVNALLAWFEVARTALSWLGVLVVVVYAMLFSAGLLYWYSRSMRELRKRIKAARDELQKEARERTLPNMAPDERMEGVDRAIAGALSANVSLEIVEALFRRRWDYDVARRLDPELRLALGDPLVGSRIHRTLRFLVSIPVWLKVKRVGRIIAALGMALIVPASLVVASPDLRASVNHKQQEVEALAAALTMELRLDQAGPPEEWRTPLQADEGPGAAKEGEQEQQEEEGKDEEAQEDRDHDSGPGTWCDAAGEHMAVEMCVAAAEFGKAFERAWGASFLNRSGVRIATEAAGISDARRAWARRQVLLESAFRRKSTVDATAADTRTPRQEAAVRATYEAEFNARTAAGPATRVGRYAAKQFGRLVKAVGQPFEVELARGPVTPSEMLSQVLGIVTGEVIDSLELGPGETTGVDTALLHELAKEGISMGTKEVTRRGADAQRAVELAVMGAIFEVERGGRMRVGPENMRSVDAFVGPDLVQQYREAIDSVTALDFTQDIGERLAPRVALGVVRASGVDLKAVEKALRQLLEQNGRVDYGVLASYASLFPGIEGQRALSDEAHMARLLDPQGAKLSYGEPPEVEGGTDGGWGGESGGGSGGGPGGGAGGTFGPTTGGGSGPRPGGAPGPKTIGAVEITPAARDHLKLARSYQRLRSYHKVGGVLIGRDPDQAPNSLDVTSMDFAHDEAGDGVIIEMTHADGRMTVLGPYDPVVAHLALVYSADGRPITVTMVATPPLEKMMKILVHPALVDTKVGCYAIKLDLFVGRFGRERELAARQEAEWLRSESVVDLYRQAWAARWLGWFDKYDSVGRELPQRLWGADHKETKEFRLDLLVEFATVPSHLQAAPLNVPEALSPLRQRPSVFNQKLVDVVEECLVELEGETDAAPVDCISEMAWEIGRNGFRGVLTDDWNGKPPMLLRNSGVREEAYVLDENLEFAQMPRDVWYGPLRFVVLNSIAMDWRWRTKTAAEVVDEHEPWELEEIQQSLETAVLSAVRVDPEAYRTLRTMQEFTVAQRLFRAAFDGRLGEQFPVERLVELARTTAEFVDFGNMKTDRWRLPEPGKQPDAEEATDADQLRQALVVPEPLGATCLHW